VLFDAVRLTKALAGRGKKGEAPMFAVHLPLRTGYPTAVEGCAWIDLFARRFSAPAMPQESHLFLRPPASGRPGELALIHRELRPEDLEFVLSPTEDYPYGNVLGTDPADDDPEVEEFWRSFRERTGESPTLDRFVEEAADL